jgi:hypothetical protein
MSIDNTTYNFCIESLRYIHKMLGYDAIIQELHFINHLQSPPKAPHIPEHIVNAMCGLDDVTEYSYDSERDTTENKNIVIESKGAKGKYVRAELSDEKRCETILPTGNRCTFKRADNSTNCSRHTK